MPALGLSRKFRGIFGARRRSSGLLLAERIPCASDDGVHGESREHTVRRGRATIAHRLECRRPEGRRPVCIAVNDTLVALPTILLIVGGAVIDRAGFTPVFIAVGAGSAGAALSRLRFSGVEGFGRGTTFQIV